MFMHELIDIPVLFLRTEPRRADEKGAAGNGGVPGDGAQRRAEHHRRGRRGASAEGRNPERRVQIQEARRVTNMG